MEVDAYRDVKYGSALRLPESTEDAGRPALERARYSQSTIHHRGQSNAPALQRGETVALHPGRVSERRALQQRYTRGREIFRATSGEGQLRASRRCGLGDQPEDDSSRRLRTVLGQIGRASCREGGGERRVCAELGV